MTTTAPLSREQIRQYAAAALPGATAAQLDVAVAVALAESAGRPDVISTTNDYGLWQINARAHPQYSTASLLTPAYNARAMAAISKGGVDWSPWVAFKTGAYRKHLTSGGSDAVGLSGGVPGGGFIEGIIDVAGGNPVGGAVDAGNASIAAGEWADGVISRVAVALLALVFTATGLGLVVLGLSRLGKDTADRTGLTNALSTAGAVAAIT